MKQQRTDCIVFTHIATSHTAGCCPVSDRLAKQTKRLVLCAVQLLSD